jgi:hypothetical protein
MSNAGKVHRNTRTHSSAAAFVGVIGVPDPGRGPAMGDGGLRTFARVFNARFDELAETTRPELRSFARTERYFARTLAG